MRVKLLTARVTLRHRYDIGDEIDVPDPEGLRLIKAGQAVPVRSAAPERRPQEDVRERVVAMKTRTKR